MQTTGGDTTAWQLPPAHVSTPLQKTPSSQSAFVLHAVLVRLTSAHQVSHLAGAPVYSCTVHISVSLTGSTCVWLKSPPRPPSSLPMGSVADDPVWGASGGPDHGCGEATA